MGYEIYERSEDVLEKSLMRLKMDKYDMRVEVESLKTEASKLREEINALISIAAVVNKNEIIVANNSEELVVKVVSEIFNVSVEDMESKGRGRPLLYARKFVWYYLKYSTEMSLSALGKLFNRDHSTVINSLEDYDWLYDNVPSFRIKCDSSISLIKQSLEESN